jgi:L-alanine-DL-glutamate epimerase-like enolase superfamily enzyme
MKIDSIDFFYLSMPVVTEAADGSQDALPVRVTSGGHQGWGECEAAPLPSIAAFVTPMSHGACRPVSASVLGERLEERSFRRHRSERGSVRPHGADRKWLPSKAGDWRFLRCGLPLLMGSKRARS